MKVVQLSPLLFLDGELFAQEYIGREAFEVACEENKRNGDTESLVHLVSEVLRWMLATVAYEAELLPKCPRSEEITHFWMRSQFAAVGTRLLGHLIVGQRGAVRE